MLLEVIRGRKLKRIKERGPQTDSRVILLRDPLCLIDQSSQSKSQLCLASFYTRFEWMGLTVFFPLFFLFFFFSFSCIITDCTEFSTSLQTRMPFTTTMQRINSAAKLDSFLHRRWMRDMYSMLVLCGEGKKEIEDHPVL